MSATEPKLKLKKMYEVFPHTSFFFDNTQYTKSSTIKVIEILRKEELYD